MTNDLLGQVKTLSQDMTCLVKYKLFHNKTDLNKTTKKPKSPPVESPGRGGGAVIQGSTLGLRIEDCEGFLKT